MKLGTARLPVSVGAAPHTATVICECESGLWRCVENSSNGHSKQGCEYTSFVALVRTSAELPITRRATSKSNHDHDCGVFHFLSVPRLCPVCATIFSRVIHRQRMDCAPSCSTRGVQLGLE